MSKKPLIGPVRPIKMEDHIINYVSESKCSRITVDSKLNWESHIKNSASNMNSKIKQLKRMKSLPTEVLETINFKGILPGSTYGISVWGNCSSTKMEHLEKVHRRAARIIHKIPRGTDNEDVLKKANWKSVQDMYKRKVICLTHKAYYGNCPDEISKIIEKSGNVRNMRDNLKLNVPRPKTEDGKKTFKYRSALLRNLLPERVKNIKNYDNVKKTLTKHAKEIDAASFNSSATIKKKDLDNFKVLLDVILTTIFNNITLVLTKCNF